VNVERMLHLFREGLKNLSDIWTSILGAGDFRDVELLAKLTDREFRFPLDLWSRVIYDFALSFHRRIFPAEHLVKSLTPLYLGKTASFILEVQPLDQAGAESEIEKLCIAFEKNKTYLSTGWN
jgi:hypothetical protein